METNNALIECIPNFSEGQNLKTIELIESAIKSVTNVKLLHKDVGYSANRTVFTFAGEPNAVLEAAFQAIKAASKNIDMTKHKGEHPRIGATDVCPLVPISGITMEETVVLSKQLAERVANELNIPTYLYEYSASNENRKKLENIRKGEFESLNEKLNSTDWKPDYVPKKINKKAGATAICARDFLIAFNINLNTSNPTITKEIAKELRAMRDEAFKENDISLYHLKAIGWFIPEFKKCQISTNITNFHKTPLQLVYQTVAKIAKNHNIKITGCELVGLIPQKALIESGKLFSKTNYLSNIEHIELCIKKLNINEFGNFNINERVIETVLNS